MAKKVQYMDMPIDNNLEAELLKATKARDTFANEIDHKSYSLVDMETPSKIRIDYLTKRINNWEQKKEEIKNEISNIDNDETYNYKDQIKKINDMIEDIKSDISEYTTTLENEDNLIPSVRANYQASLDAKKVDLQNAENILEQFRKEECEDIQRITIELDQEIISLDEKIANANKEIETLKEELLSKKEDLTDIRAMNKDKARLKELASVVIDIKHRRNFPLQPTLIAKQLERLLGIEILDSLDSNTYTSEETSEDNQSGSDLINNLIQKDIEEIEEQYPEAEIKEEEKEEPVPKRGIRVTSETEITDSSLKEINKEEESPTEEKLGPTLKETMEKIREEKEEPAEEEDEDNEEETTESSPLDEIEKELDKRIQALKNKAIDNKEEKEDNIKAIEETTDELEEYIRQLEENK
jgi:epidermal growth factor receptor substrate 15